MSKRIQRCVGFFLFILLVAVMVIEFSPAVSTSPGDDWSASTWFHLYSPAGKSPQGATLSTLGPTGLTPTQIRKAYNLPESGGTGTIAIIDAYDSPTVQDDLVTFSNQFGLPTPNFEKHKMTGNIPVDAGWALEIALDVQWAHAIAPNAKILLVEARSALLGDLLTAVNYAKNRADVVTVSMSWGGSEFLGQSSYNSYFTSNHGVSFFASTGDSGAGVIWPSTSQNVVAVGGTTLTLNPDGTVASETGWSGSGGGISAYETEPQYQTTYNIPVANGKRCVPDVSYNGNPATGFPVYDTTAYGGQTGWFQVGGTSAGAPQWAAIHSLSLSVSNNNLYQDAKWSNPTYFRDVTSGSNGAYSAIPGYDLVTGLGSPITWNYTTGIGSDFTISTSPSSLDIQNGSLGSTNIAVTSVSGFSGNVSLSTFAPSGWNASLSLSSLVVPLGGSNQTKLSVKTPSTSQAGPYNVTVKGLSGQLNHNASLAVAVFNPVLAITGFNIISGGSGYTTPHVVLTGGGGTGASATARVSQGVIIGLVLTNPGSGYTSAPTVILKDPSPRAKGASATTVLSAT
jgi:subtilase family serine protease